jgi:hypothetical protein
VYEALLPREPGVSALGTRKDGRRWSWVKGLGWLQMHVNALVAQERSTDSAMLSTAPVMPKQGPRANLERVEQNTDPARFSSGVPAPLAPFT